MKRLLKIYAATLLIAVTTILATWPVSAAQPEKISVVYCQDCVPFQFTDENNQPAGLIIDQWRLWSEKTGTGIDFQAASWSETLRKVGAGEVDVHAGLFYNTERDAYLDYGAPLSKTDTHFFVHRDLPPIENLKDLGAYRVGVLKGDYVEGFLKQKLPGGSIVDFQSYEGIMDALKAGRLSAFAADTLTALHHLQRANLSDVFEFPSNKPLYQNEWFVAVKEGKTELLKIVNDGMEKITPDERTAIAQHWTSSAIEQDEDVLVISIPRAYPPFVISGFKGEPRGLYVEMWQLWSETTGTPIRFLSSGWQGTLDAVKTGAADVHSGLFKSDERSAWLDFSDPVHEVKTAVYFLTSSNNAANLSEFYKERVGAIADTHQEQFLKGQYGDIDLSGYNETAELISALLNEEVDFIVGEIPAIDNTLQRMGLQRDVSRGFDELLSNFIHAGVAKGNEELLQKINEGFAAIAYDKLAELDAVWMANPDHRFYRKVTETVELTREEEDWLAVHPFIRFAVTSFINPVDIVDAEGNYSGMNADLMKLLNKKLGTRIVPEIFDKWGDVAANTLSGDVDGAFSFSRTPEREKNVYFTKPYAYDPVIVIARQGDDTVRSWSDLSGKHVSVAKGFSVVDELRRQVGDGKLNLVESDEDGLKLLSEGTTDAHVSFQLPYANARKDAQVSGLRIVDAKNDEAGAFRIAVHKNQPILFSIVQKGVNALTRSELSVLQNRWLTPETPEAIGGLALSIEERQWLAAHPNISVGVMQSWPPFHIEDATGGGRSGITMGVFEAINKRLDGRLKVVPGEWKQLLEEVKNGDLDAVMDLTPMPHREPFYNFTSPYLSIPHVIIANRDGPKYLSEDDLAGKTVALERGFGNVKYLRDNYPAINVLEVESTQAALDVVSSGAADAYVGNRAVASYFMKRDFMIDLSVHGRINTIGSILAIGSRKDAPILNRILGKSLASISTAEMSSLIGEYVDVGTRDELAGATSIELSDAERMWLDTHDAVRVMVGTWPPFHFMEGQDPRGMALDYVRHILKKAGLEIEYVPIKWADALRDISNQKTVDLLPTIARSAEREKLVNISQDYLSFPRAIFARKADGYGSLEDLHGKTVSVERGFITAKLLAQDHPEINLLEVDTTKDALEAVSFGKADAFVSNMAVGSYLIDSLGLTNLSVTGRTDYKSDIQAMGVRKDWPELASIIDKSLAAMSATQVRDIRQRWIALDTAALEKSKGSAPSGGEAAKALPPEIVRSQAAAGLWTMVAIAVLIFAGLAVFVRVLLHSSRGDAVALQMGSKRFRYMIIGALLLLALLVSTISWLAYGHNKNRIVEVTGVNLQTVLNSTVERLKIWTDDEKNQIARVGRDPELAVLTKALLTLPRDKQPLQFSQALANIRTYFQNLDHTQDSKGFFIITPDGINIGSMRDENLADKNLIATQAPDLFKRVVGGEATFIPPIRSDVQLDPGAGGDALPPTMFFAAPIVDEDGTVLAVMTDRIDPTDAFTRIVQTGNVGESGETYAFDISGLMMSSSRFNDDLVQRGLLEEGQSSILNVVVSPPAVNDATKLTFMAQSAVSGRSGVNMDGYDDYRGVKVLGAWTWDDELGFGLATEIDAVEALDTVDTLRRTILTILALTLTLSVGATLFTLTLGERTSAALIRAKEELEGRVEERTAEVQRQRDLIKAVMDSMTVGVAAFDDDLKLIAWNQKYLDIRGYPEEIVFDGASFEDLIRYDVERGEFGEGDPEQIFAEKVEGAHKFEPHAFDRQRPNGTFIEVLGGPIVGGGFVSTYADITERKRMEVELTVAKVKAEEATRSKAAFLAAMSHEIRTPMNGVVGMISLLQETELETDQRTMMNTVQDSAFSLLQIINDILDFSKIEAGKLSLEKIPVNIDTVLESVTETLLPAISKKNLRMALFIDPDIPEHVLTDQVRLRQILFNMAGNATKFTSNTPERQGKVTLRADLTEPVKDGRVNIRLSVIDNGIGMKPEAVSKLFTPFTQADQSTTRKFGGTGLGLSICKTLTELMGGKVGVESTEGEGSSFYATLPFEIAEDSEDHIRKFDLSGLNIAYTVKFDDTAEAVERYATAGGAQVTRLPAADIVANVKKLAESKPLDIVVLGAMDDGQERDEVIEGLRDLSGLRFVILTPDRSERRGMILPDMVVMASAPVRKTAFMHGVAMAAGRASPEVNNEAIKLSAGARKAPAIEDARKSGELVLVAEDNITNQDVIRRQLNVLGYACEVADDGMIALEMLKGCSYGLLLTDCHMPNMDGYELTGALRNLEMDLDNRLPVVAITANALQGEADRCLAVGMDDYLAKPLEMNKLKAMLAKWLPVDHGDVADTPAAETEAKAAPVADTPADADAVVNVKALTDMFGEDKDLLKEILGDYVQPSSDIIGEIDAGYEAHDADAVGKAGHKLKSSSRAIGADALADLCAALEQAGKSGDWGEIKKLYLDLHHTFDAVVGFIEEL